jgi:hypothetical protein
MDSFRQRLQQELALHAADRKQVPSWLLKSSTMSDQSMHADQIQSLLLQPSSFASVCMSCICSNGQAALRLGSMLALCQNVKRSCWKTYSPDSRPSQNRPRCKKRGGTPPTCRFCRGADT